MTASRIIRGSGLLSMGFGVLLALTFILGLAFPEPDPTTAAHVILGTLRTLTPALGILALTGLYARQAAQAGKLGLVGYLIAFFGVAMVLGLEFSFTYLFPVFAIGAPDFVAQLDAGQVEPAGPILVIFILVDVVFLAGFILFGVATLRAQVFPRRAVTVMLVGAVALSISDYLPGFVAPAGAVLMGLGFVWLGYTLWSGIRDSAAQAATAAAT